MSDYPLESFVFYRSFRDAIEEMPDNEKLATLIGICDYALYGVEPKLKSAMARAVFTVARPSIDANKGRRKNGKMGGRPKKETDNPEEESSGFELENHRFSKSESTETETVSETGANKAGKPPTPSRKKHGKYGWVQLTDSDYNRLLNDLGENEVERCIAYIDEAAQSTKNKNRWRDWNLVVRRCHRDGWGLRDQNGKEPFPQSPVSRGRLVVNDDGEEVVVFDE